MASLAFETDADKDFAELLASDGESADGAAGEQQAGKAKKIRKAAAKVKNVEKKSSPKKGNPEQGWKKCKTCGTFKEDGSFNANQAKCKDCFNDLRALQRTAERQGSRQELEQMEASEPKMHTALVKAFVKERQKAKKTGQKLKFTIASFRITYRSSSGLRAEAESEYMWEGEYKEFATKTAKGGYLSSQEAQESWDRMLADATVARDTKGPRNFVRLLIKVRDKVVNYDDVFKEKALSKEEKINKNASQAVFDARMGMVVGEDGLEKHDFCDFENLKRKANQAFAHSKPDEASGFSGAGVLSCDFDDLLDGVKTKLKKRTGLGSNGFLSSLLTPHPHQAC